MKGSRTEIEIHAPLARVWELVTDLAAYPQWNPLFRRGEGMVATGGRLQLVAESAGIGPVALQPEVLVCRPQAEFRWRHHSRLPGVFGWEHRFLLQSTEAGAVRLIQEAWFHGVLAPLLLLGLGKPLRAGCEQLNAVLKRWSEKEAIQCLRC